MPACAEALNFSATSSLSNQACDSAFSIVVPLGIGYALEIQNRKSKLQNQMSLTPEQKQVVAQWVTEGDNLSIVQKKLLEEFEITMTYMDVRFLVDDLELTLKDAAPKVDASDVSKAPPPPPPPAATEGETPATEEIAPEPVGNVTVNVDHATLDPNALASGDVTFSDGVTGKWIVDHSGRPGFTEISQPGYRPSPEDGQAFMQELSQALQKKGI